MSDDAPRPTDSDQVAVLKKLIYEQDEKGWRLDATMASDFVKVLAHILAECFEGSGAVNCVEFSVMHSRLGPMVMTLQRSWGKTPMEMCNEAKARAAAYGDAMMRLMSERLIQGYAPTWMKGVLSGAAADEWIVERERDRKRIADLEAENERLRGGAQDTQEITE